MVLSSVRALGFDPKDIKYIIHTHHHGDHVDATPAIVEATGAKTVISTLDDPIAYACHGIKADITVEDGDTLSLGNKTIRFLLTPGHTVGTLSLFFDATHEGVIYRVGTFGGAGANTLVPESRDFYPACRADYAKSIERLLAEEVDIFIGNHVWNNDTEEKGKRLLAGGKNEFIDPEEWKKFLLFRREVLLSLPPL
jgi:metallo-beta-lactamase class B